MIRCSMLAALAVISTVTAAPANAKSIHPKSTYTTDGKTTHTYQSATQRRSIRHRKAPYRRAMLAKKARLAAATVHRLEYRLRRSENRRVTEIRALRRDNARLRADLAPIPFLRVALRIPVERPAVAFRDVPVATALLAVLPPETPSRLPADGPQPIIAPMRTHHRGPSLVGLPKPLVVALERVGDACAGFKVISTYRKNARVRGSGRRSLHADWKAADFKVQNYKCAYAALKGWRGGMSTDPWKVGHIHLSYSPGSREFGHRFAHWQPHRARTAKRIKPHHA